MFHYGTNPIALQLPLTTPQFHFGIDFGIFMLRIRLQLRLVRAFECAFALYNVVGATDVQFNASSSHEGSDTNLSTLERWKAWLLQAGIEPSIVRLAQFVIYIYLIHATC